jgi:hypothetical protein
MRTWRSSRWLPIWLAVCAGAAGLGCGGDDDDDEVVDAGVDAGGELDELGAALARSLCPKLLECCTAPELGELFDDGPPSDETSCVTALTGPMEELVAGLAGSVAAGRARYDGARMEACLERIEQVACGEFAGFVGEEELFASCEAAPFIAEVDDGGACGADVECKSRFCAGRGEGELGSCAALPGAGDTCPESRCAEGLYCDSLGPSCVAQRADGESCAAEDECLSGACPQGTCGAEPTCDGQE